MSARSLGALLATTVLGCQSLTGLSGAGSQPGGNPGPEDAGPEAEASTCSNDLTRDPKNCGRCGHDCLGGDCKAGLCAPIVLATGQANPEDIVVAPDGAVYWTNLGDGTVIELKPGGAPRAIVTGQPGPRGIAYHAGTVYFTNLNAGTIMAFDAKGLRQVNSDADPYDVVADDAAVYWVSHTSGAARMDLVNGFISRLSTTRNAYAIALGGKLPFWICEGTSPNGYVDGSVETRDGQGAALSRQIEHPRGIAADGATAYVTSFKTSGAIYVLENTDLKVFVNDQQQPSGIALDAQTVYWVNEHPGGELMAASRATGTARVLASGLSSPHALALDATSVYFTNGDGTVMKLAK